MAVWRESTPACKYHFLRTRLRLVWAAKTDLEEKLSTIWRTIIEGGSTTISSLVGRVLWQFERNQTPACKYHFLRTRLRLVWVAKMDLEKKLSTIWRTVMEGGSPTISSLKSLVGWVLRQFEANQILACKYHFLRIRLRLDWVAKMDLEKKLSTILRTVIEGGSTTTSSWKSLVGRVLWQFEGNQTPTCKYHFLRIRLRLVWVATMDLEMKLCTIWRRIIERGSTTITSWKSLVGRVLWQFEGNQTPACKYHYLRTRVKFVWVAKMDLEKKLSTIWRTIIERGSTTITSWKSLVGRVLWQFEVNQTLACKYHFLRTRLRLVWVVVMDLEKKLSTIWRTIIEEGPTTTFSWKSLVGWVLWHFEGIQLKHANTISWG